MASGAKMTEEAKRPKSELGGVVVIDFGGQYTQLIARRVREQQVFSAVLPFTSKISDIQKFEPAGIILSGGPSSAYDAGSAALRCGGAVDGDSRLGICYGMHWITKTMGGKVVPAERREYGSALLNVAEGDGSRIVCLPGCRRRCGSGIATATMWWVYPTVFTPTAQRRMRLRRSKTRARKIYTVEFHPEVRHTDQGTELLRNFLFRVCMAEPKWSGAAFIEETTEAIRKKAGRAG